MNKDSKNSKNEVNSESASDGLITEVVDEFELELYSQFFHDLRGAINPDVCNRFLRDVVQGRKQGFTHGLQYLLTVHKTFLVTTEQFELTDEQERELVQMLLSAAAKPYDEPISFEPVCLEEEQVEFARLVADAIFQTSATVDTIFRAPNRSVVRTNTGNGADQ